MNIKELKKIRSFATKDNDIYINLSYFSLYFTMLPEQASMYVNKKEKVIDILIGDEKLFNYLLSLLANGIDEYVIYLYDDSNILYKHNVVISDIISLLALGSDSKHKSKLKKINYLTTNKLYKRRFLKKDLYFGITYKDIIKILSKEPNEFLTWLETNNSLKGQDIYNAIEHVNIVNFAKEIIKESELNNLRLNIKYIKEKYEKDEEWKRFVPYRGNVDMFDLDPSILVELKKGMPEHFNDIQKAYYGYRRICELFTYNKNYLIKLNYSVVENINRLNHIKIGDPIVCNEATMIFAKFLDSLDIPFRIINYDNQDEFTYKTHIRLLFQANEAVVFADIAEGAVKGDIAFSKFHDYTYNFGPYGEDERTVSRVKECINEANDYINNNYIDPKQKKCRQLLKTLKIAKDTHQMDKLSVEEKIKKLLSCISLLDFSSMDLFDVVEDISYYIFNRVGTYHDIEFIINHSPYDDEEDEVVICVTINKNGIIKDIENNEYYIFNYGKLKEKLSLEEIKERFKNDEFEYTSKRRHIPGIENTKGKAK